MKGNLLLFLLFLVGMLTVFLVFATRVREGHAHTNLVMTRFSVLDCDDSVARRFRVYEEEPDCAARTRALFSKIRLERKFTAFERKTFPSVLSQTASNYVFYIFVAKRLPRVYMRRLSRLVEAADTEKVHIVPVDNFNEFNTKIKKEIAKYPRYTTVRLDDDDWLHRDFLKNLNRHKDKKGTIVSFPRGREFSFCESRNQFVEGKSIEKPRIAVGLAGVQLNIYACGKHTTVDQRFPVLYDFSLNPAYGRYVGPGTDTHTKKHRTKKKGNNEQSSSQTRSFLSST